MLEGSVALRRLLIFFFFHLVCVLCQEIKPEVGSDVAPSNIDSNIILEDSTPQGQHDDVSKLENRNHGRIAVVANGLTEEIKPSDFRDNEFIKTPLMSDIAKFNFDSASPTSFVSPKKEFNHRSLSTRDIGAKKHGRVLVFPPIVFESHLFIFRTLASGLMKFGHDVSVYISDRRTTGNSLDGITIRTFPGIFSSEESSSFLQSKVSNILSSKPTWIELFDIIGEYSRNCDLIFSQGRDSIEQLRRDKYDIVVVDPNEMCGFLIARELGIPYVIFSTGMWVPYESYMPSPISYVPEFNSQFSDHMTLPQRTANLFLYLVSRFATKYVIFPMYDRLIVKHRIGFNATESNYKYTNDLSFESRLWLLSTDVALEFPRPSMPHVEYVGGILGRPATKLPEPLLEWADSSADSGGFIVVSFGAGVKRLNPSLEAIFVEALSKLPYQVIWRYPKPLPVGLGAQVTVVDWLPQSDLIGHPNIRAFVGHGGTNGVYECLYHGVPIVGMPLFGDHYDSMARVHAKKLGISLSWRNLTVERLLDAIMKVATDPLYRDMIQKYSRIHHDQPMSPLEKASYKIDYVIRYIDGTPNGGLNHLRPHVYNIPLYQYFLVDVLLAMGIGCLGVGWIATALISRYYLKLPSSRWNGQFSLPIKRKYSLVVDLDDELPVADLKDRPPTRRFPASPINSLLKFGRGFVYSMKSALLQPGSFVVSYLNRGIGVLTGLGQDICSFVSRCDQSSTNIDFPNNSPATPILLQNGTGGTTTKGSFRVVVANGLLNERHSRNGMNLITYPSESSHKSYSKNSNTYEESNCVNNNVFELVKARGNSKSMNDDSSDSSRHLNLGNRGEEMTSFAKASVLPQFIGSPSACSLSDCCTPSTAASRNDCFRMPLDLSRNDSQSVSPTDSHSPRDGDTGGVSMSDENLNT